MEAMDDDTIALAGRRRVGTKDRVSAAGTIAVLASRSTSGPLERQVDLDGLVECRVDRVHFLFIGTRATGMLDLKLVGFASPSILADLELCRIDRFPNGLLGLGVVDLEGHLMLSRDEHDAQVGINELTHEERAVVEDRVPDLGLGLEAFFGRA